MAKIPNIEDLCGELQEDTKSRVAACGPISLASVCVGEDYSSVIYSAQQEKMAKNLGVGYTPVVLKESSGCKELCDRIKELNQDDSVTGILINKPFPSGWEEQTVFSYIDSLKDVEGMNPYNLGRLFMNKPRFISPTVISILKFLDISIGFNQEALAKKEIVIVGSSTLIGKPLAMILANMLATVTITNISTYENGRLPFYVKNGDVVISAAGRPGLIKGDWLKEGCVVIDVGAGRKNGKVCGDVEFKEARERASFLTPVPGGVGKLTTIFLFRNLLRAARARKNGF